MSQLSDHFTLDELAGSATAVRLGIDNTPPAEVLPRLTTLALALEQVRRVLERPVQVLSGYRCEELERLLSAKDYAAWCARNYRPLDDASWAEYFRRKAHPQGWAADLVSPLFGPPLAIARVVKASGIKFDQLIAEGATASGGGWVHFSIDPRMRGETLTAIFHDGTPLYTQGVS